MALTRTRARATALDLWTTPTSTSATCPRPLLANDDTQLATPPIRRAHPSTASPGSVVDAANHVAGVRVAVVYSMACVGAVRPG